MNEDIETPTRICFRDVAPAIEFACWIVVVLCPVLRLVNGPAVTNDQFAFQVTLFSLALVGAIALRAYRLFRSRHTGP